MPRENSTRRLGGWMVVFLVLPVLLVYLAVVGTVIAGGWSYYSNYHGKALPEQVASATHKQSTDAVLKLDLDGAVAALRGDAPFEIKTQALAVLEQLAKSGNAKAMVMTAACYRVGLGTVADDHYKAFEWYRKAAQAGEPAAMLEMSRYYVDGVWVEANAAQSKQWLEKAAKAGSVEAKWQLGRQGT